MIIRYAKVIEGGEVYKVQFFGEEDVSETVYKRLSYYVPQKGDVIAFIIDNKNKYLCIGKVE